MLLVTQLAAISSYIWAVEHKARATLRYYICHIHNKVISDRSGKNEGGGGTDVWSVLLPAVC